MKINNLIIAACLCASLSNLSAQSNIADIIQNLDKKLISVDIGKEKGDPSVSSDKKSPCTVIFSVEDTDAKGKSETSTYEIGLADLSPQLLKATTKGNVRLVEVATKDRQEFIKFTKDGDFKGYVNKFNLPAYDNDAAKDIMDLLKSAIETCEKTVSDACAKPTTFNDATNQLKSLIQKISINETTIEQDLQFDKSIPTRAVLTVRESAKSKTSERTFAFDFADMADNKVKFTVSSKQLKINIFSRNGDLIQRKQDGKCQSNENDLTLLAANIEQAKCLVKTLQSGIAIARDEADKRLPSLTDLGAALKLAADNVQTFEQCGTTREQSLDKKSLTTYSITTNTEGGKKSGDKQSYSFNFTDINLKSIAMKISGNSIGVKMQTTDNKNFIKVLKNNELQSYDNEVLFFAKTGEEAKLLMHALKKIVDLTPKSATTTCDKNGVDALECAVKMVKTIKKGDDEVKQKLERLPDNAYKLRLSIEVFKGKTTEEVNYEFNFKDIDPRRIELKISGKEVSVVLPTKNNEKIIKENKKDKTGYDNSVTIKVEDIESGRDLMQTLQKVVN
jgi:hypothetical protein